MATNNSAVNYDSLKGYAQSCNTFVTELEKMNKELNDLVKQLQPLWKTKKANKMYKKFKGNINHTYQWSEKFKDLNDEIIKTSSRIKRTLGD